MSNQPQFDERGRRYLRSIPLEARNELKRVYYTDWETFVEHVRPGFLKGLGISEDDPRQFVFLRTSDIDNKMDVIMQSLYNGGYTVEQLVKALISLKAFGLAEDYMRNYVSEKYQAVLQRLYQAEMRRVEDEQTFIENQLKEKSESSNGRRGTAATSTSPTTRVRSVYCTAPVENVYLQLEKLFDARTQMARLMDENPYLNDPAAREEIRYLLTNVSHNVPVTMYPRQNANQLCLDYIISRTSPDAHSGLNQNSMYVTGKFMIPFDRSDHSILIEMGNLVSTSLWGKFIPFCNPVKGKLIPDDTEALTEAERGLLNELSVLQCLHSPNIVQLAGVLISPWNIHVLFHQHGLGCNLEQALQHRLYGPNTYGFLWTVMSQIFYAVQYLHFHQPYAVVHNNLCFSNVLLDDACKIQLCGFTNAKCVAPFIPNQQFRWLNQETDIVCLGKMLNEFIDSIGFKDSIYEKQITLLQDLAEALKKCGGEETINTMTAILIMESEKLSPVNSI